MLLFRKTLKFVYSLAALSVTAIIFIYHQQSSDQTNKLSIRTSFLKNAINSSFLDDHVNYSEEGKDEYYEDYITTPTLSSTTAPLPNELPPSYSESMYTIKRSNCSILVRSIKNSTLDFEKFLQSSSHQLVVSDAEFEDAVDELSQLQSPSFKTLFADIYLTLKFSSFNIIISQLWKADRDHKFYLFHDPIRKRNRAYDEAYFNNVISLQLIQHGSQHIELPGLQYANDSDGFITSASASIYVPCDYQQAHKTQVDFDEPASEIDWQKPAQLNLGRVRRIFAHFGMRAWLAGGTLLGWFRQCDIIPKSSDLDMAVNISDLNLDVVAYLNDSSRDDYWLYWQLGEPNDLFEMAVYGDGWKTDVFVTYNNENKSWVGQHFWTAGYKYRHYYPNQNLTLCSTEMLGALHFVPCTRKQTKAQLRADYGDSFMIPNRDSWASSRPNMRYVGSYPKEKWDLVYRWDYMWRFGW